MTEKQLNMKKITNLDISFFSEMDALKKLRIAVVTIFILSSISVPLLLIGSMISALLWILSYIILLILMIKLMIIKKI